MAKKKETKKTSVQTLSAASPDERRKAADAAMEMILQKYGDGAVMYLGKYKNTNVQVIPSGSLSLDIALGVGGLPRGRIVEVYGPEAGGKTTLTLQAIAQAQKLGGIAAFIDVEHALSPSYARKLGVDIDRLIVSQPDSGEQAMEIADMLIRSSAVDILVIDSVAALVSKAEIEGDMGDAHVGLQARLMSQGLRKLTASISKTGTVAVFINQIRDKIGAMAIHGNPQETTPGGRALRFYASVRIDVRKADRIMDGDQQIGVRTRCKIAKNKVAPPFKTCEYDMIFGQGLSYSGELLDVGVMCGVIRKSGAWFYYGDDRLGQGREKAKEFLDENEDFFTKIDREVREKAAIMTFDENDDDDDDTAATGTVSGTAAGTAKPRKSAAATADSGDDTDSADEFSLEELG